MRSRLLLATPLIAPLTLGDARPLTAARGYGELCWAPDSSAISAFVPTERRFEIVDLAGRRAQAPGEHPGTFRHRWDPASGALIAHPEPAGPAWVERDDLWVRDGGAARRVTQGEDRFYDPVASPDGRWVAFSGLVTGLHVLEVPTGALSHLGPGRWPTWSPAGLVFERDEDDGHALTEADLWSWTPGAAEPAQLTRTPGVLERYPSVSPDGRMLAFVRDGALVIAELRP